MAANPGLLDHDVEPAHSASPTADLLDQLQLYGHRPYEDDPDPRPLPDPEHLERALADVFDALVASLADTRLEPDLADLLSSQVNSSTARSIASSASSTIMRMRSARARRSRTAPRSARSSSSASSPKG